MFYFTALEVSFFLSQTLQTSSSQAVWSCRTPNQGFLLLSETTDCVYNINHLFIHVPEPRICKFCKFVSTSCCVEWKAAQPHSGFVDWQLTFKENSLQSWEIWGTFFCATEKHSHSGVHDPVALTWAHIWSKPQPHRNDKHTHNLRQQTTKSKDCTVRYTHIENSRSRACGLLHVCVPEMHNVNLFHLMPITDNCLYLTASQDNQQFSNSLCRPEWKKGYSLVPLNLWNIPPHRRWHVCLRMRLWVSSSSPSPSLCLLTPSKQVCLN